MLFTNCPLCQYKREVDYYKNIRYICRNCFNFSAITDNNYNLLSFTFGMYINGVYYSATQDYINNIFIVMRVKDKYWTTLVHLNEVIITNFDNLKEQLESIILFS